MKQVHERVDAEYKELVRHIAEHIVDSNIDHLGYVIVSDDEIRDLATSDIWFDRYGGVAGNAILGTIIDVVSDDVDACAQYITDIRDAISDIISKGE